MSDVTTRTGGLPTAIEMIKTSSIVMLGALGPYFGPVLLDLYAIRPIIGYYPILSALIRIMGLFAGMVIVIIYYGRSESA